MNAAEFIYTVLLKPKPLRWMADGILRSIIPGEVVYDGVRIVLNPNDPVVSGALFLRVYERPETRFVLSVLRPGMRILDVGANLGYYTALFGVKTGAAGRVVALEPDPENFRFLQKTIQANRLTNVAAVQAAAGAEAGHLLLFRSANNRGDNRMYANELASSSEEVRVARGDEILAEQGIEKIDFLKVDVQGYEGQVIAGLETTLRRSKGLIAMLEFWPYGLTQAGTDPVEYLELLRSWGFRIYELGESGGPRLAADSRSLVAAYPGRRYGNIALYGPEAKAPAA